MVARLRVRQVQKDVNATEEAELRRLENGATASDADGTLDLAETVTCSGTETVVLWTAARKTMAVAWS